MITKELQNKLVTRCQNPRTVVNKYTHEPVVVSCGSCPSCILRRSGIQTNLLTSYSAQFRYVYFVTLTYAPCFLPTLEVSVVETCTDDIADVSVVPDINDLDACDPNTYLFGFRSVPRSASVKLKNSTVERTFKDPDIRFSYAMTPKELLSILNKVKHNVPNRIPYVCNRDLDLFLKRLRSYYPDEKLRYYAVSEYGPTSYRPHWHLLLFSDSERFSKTVFENVSKAWFYGRCDASLSRGFAAPYVASYVNSFVSLPTFLRRCQDYCDQNPSTPLDLQSQISSLEKYEYQELMKLPISVLMEYALNGMATFGFLSLRGRISFDYSPDFQTLFVNLHRTFISYYLLRSQRPNESFVADALI